MLPDVTWAGLLFVAVARFVLDGGHAHNEGPVTFETALTTVVAVLALVGVLWYFGLVGSPPEGDGIDADEEPDEA